MGEIMGEFGLKVNKRTGSFGWLSPKRTGSFHRLITIYNLVYSLMRCY
jgi:hypothetical protein